MNTRILIIGGLGVLGLVVLLASRKSDGKFSLPAVIDGATSTSPAPSPSPAPAPTPVVQSSHAPAITPVQRQHAISVGIDGAQMAPTRYQLELLQ